MKPKNTGSKARKATTVPKLASSPVKKVGTIPLKKKK